MWQSRGAVLFCDVCNAEFASGQACGCVPGASAPASSTPDDEIESARRACGKRAARLLTMDGLLARMAKLAVRAAQAADELTIKKITAERLILQELRATLLARREVDALDKLERRLSSLEQSARGHALENDLAETTRAQES